jgi:hypothetical protein
LYAASRYGRVAVRCTTHRSAIGVEFAASRCVRIGSRADITRDAKLATVLIFKVRVTVVGILVLEVTVRDLHVNRGRVSERGLCASEAGFHGARAGAAIAIVKVTVVATFARYLEAVAAGRLNDGQSRGPYERWLDLTRRSATVTRDQISIVATFIALGISLCGRHVAVRCWRVTAHRECAQLAHRAAMVANFALAG